MAVTILSSCRIHGEISARLYPAPKGEICRLAEVLD